MKGKPLVAGIIAACLMLLVLTEAVTADPLPFPSIAAPIVSQGTLAVNLAASLGLNAGSQVVAINSLSQIGIIPRGGWVPTSLVTPALIGELQNSIFLAARSGQLLITPNKVLTRFNTVTFRLGVPVFPVSASSRAAFLNANIISSSQINRFFINNGLPVMTFFTPPRRFINQFTFTPFPFVCSNVFFPGFFVRQDVSNRFFVNVSNFGRTTSSLVQLDNARGFSSVRFSTDALLAERLRSPFFNTAFQTPVGFAFTTFSPEGLFVNRLLAPFFAPGVVTPGSLVRQDINTAFFVSTSNFGRTTPALVQLDNALGFNSVRFSTDALLTARVLAPFSVTAFKVASFARPVFPRFSNNVLLTAQTLSPFSVTAFKIANVPNTAFALSPFRTSAGFVVVSDFGRTTPALINVNNALAFQSIRVSNDALLTAQRFSPFSVTAFKIANVPNTAFALSPFRTSAGFVVVSNFGRTTPTLINVDNALGFQSIRVSNDALLTAQKFAPFSSTAFKIAGFTNPAFFPGFRNVSLLSRGSLVPGFSSIGAPRAFARTCGGRGAGRRR